MSANIWDGYGDWSVIAADDSIEHLKRLITGTPDWAPNYVSAALAVFFETVVSTHREYGVDACALDLGCGLGRNAPLLRAFFPRVVGLDLPEMIQRLNQTESSPAANLYDALYENIETLVQKEQVHVTYDSVVLQHIVSVPYVGLLISKLLSMPTFKTLVSLRHNGVNQTVGQGLLLSRGWRQVFAEHEDISFQGTRHNVVILRRPF